MLPYRGTRRQYSRSVSQVLQSSFSTGWSKKAIYIFFHAVPLTRRYHNLATMSMCDRKHTCFAASIYVESRVVLVASNIVDSIAPHINLDRASEAGHRNQMRWVRTMHGWSIWIRCRWNLGTALNVSGMTRMNRGGYVWHLDTSCDIIPKVHGRWISAI